MSETSFLSTEQLRQHWQGHRGLTRRVIEAFPEEQMATFSIGGMRTFSQLMSELMMMSTTTLQGVVSGTWPEGRDGAGFDPTVKAELLAAWDADTATIDALWPQLTPDRMLVEDVAFGQWPGTNQQTLRYVIDNEIHHRAQAYVYLRALGIEPPGFYEREF